MSGADQITGGAAFPGHGSAVCIPADMMDRAHEIKVRNDGMTLRDYFAAKAMQAYVFPEMLHGANTDAEISLEFTNTAAFAYRMADAMLKAGQS